MTLLKVIVAGVMARPGIVGCPIVRVTGKVCVPTVVLRITAPVYVLGVRPLTWTLTTGEAGVTPLASSSPLIASQLPPLSVIVFALQCNAVEQP